jgi:hypothetical protein
LHGRSVPIAPNLQRCVHQRLEYKKYMMAHAEDARRNRKRKRASTRDAGATKKKKKRKKTSQTNS